jgi:hypothetical protein
MKRTPYILAQPAPQADLYDLTRALTLVQPMASAICPGLWAPLQGPGALLWLNSGPKSIENRDWPPYEYMLGKRIWIHAGKRGLDAAYLSMVRALWPEFKIYFGETGEHCPRGAIIGSARIAGYLDARNSADPKRVLAPKYGAEVEEHMTAVEVQLRASGVASSWWLGPVGWFLSERTSLLEYVPCRGSHKLWEVPAEVLCKLPRLSEV